MPCRPLARFALAFCFLTSIGTVAAQNGQINSTTKWSANHDPAPTAAAVKLPVRAAIPRGAVASLRIATAKPVAFFERHSDPNGVIGGDDFPRSVDRVDLVNTKASTSLDLPSGLKMAAVSPDGEQFAAVGVTSTRIEVWSATGKNRVAGWELDPSARQPRPGIRRPVVAFTAADRLLTITPGGVVTTWSLPNAKAVATANLGAVDTATVTPGGKYAVVVRNGVVLFIDSATGKPAGELRPTHPAAPGPPTPPALAIRPDGKELAAALFCNVKRSGKQNPERLPVLVRWDLATGKMTDEITIDYGTFAGTGMNYAGPEYLLDGDGRLLDLTRREVVWQIAFKPIIPATNPADAKVWYTYAVGLKQVKGPAGKPVLMTDAAIGAVALPTKELQTAIGAVVDSPNLLLKPGGSATVQVTTPAGPFGDRVKSRVQADMEQRFASGGAGGSATVRVTFEEKDSGKVAQFMKVVPPPADGAAPQQVKLYDVTAKVEVVANGQTIWASPPITAAVNPNTYEVRLGNGETDVETAVRRITWDQVAYRVRSAEAPRFLALTPGGLRMLPGVSGLPVTLAKK